MSAVITSLTFTCREQKDTFTSQFAPGPLITALFQSMESLWGLLPKYLAFFKPNKTEIMRRFPMLPKAMPKGINWAFKLQHPVV